MMVEKQPISVDIGASLRAEVKTEIPKQPSGRLVDALTDIIRPFSERRGLRADRIRLQREEVLLIIAQKARKRIELEHIHPQPLPNKFMVPFLETASLEEIENKKLSEMWTNLLVSSTREFRVENTLYIKILGQLSSREATLFESLMTKFAARGSKVRYWSSHHYSNAPDLISPPTIYIHHRDHLKNTTPKSWPKKILRYFEGPGIRFAHINVAEGKFRQYPYEDISTYSPPSFIGANTDELSFEILRTAGLVQKTEIDELQVDDNLMLSLICYTVTDIGVRFFEAVADPKTLARAHDPPTIRDMERSIAMLKGMFPEAAKRKRNNPSI